MKPAHLESVISQLGSRRVFVLALGGLLAACGGGGGGVDTPTTATQAPTLIIRSDVTGEVRGNVNVQFFFSAPALFTGGQPELGFSLSGASKVPGSFKQLSSDTWQVTLTPSANQQGMIDLRVPPGAFTDSTGAASNTAAYEYAQPFNTIAPFAKLEFAGPLNSFGLIAGVGTFTLRFDAVLDAPLAVDKIAYTAGSIGQFQKTSGTGQKDTYTFVFSPPPATFGSVTFELPKGAVTSGGVPNNRDWWNFGLATP